MWKAVQKYAIKIAFVQSLIATAGSLFFSEVMKFTPCKLCWYQRICMYPLTLIFAAGLYRKDKNIVWYALPLAVVGLSISIYHNLIYYGVITEKSLLCVPGFSCISKYITWFGFVSIPLLAFTAFTVIITCLTLYLKSKK
jgi:disulfide bond formation protein DsbB